MKRISCAALMCLLFPLFASGAVESWSAIGGEYTHFYGSEHRDSYYTVQDEYGMYLGYAGFVNDNSFGLYMRNIIQVPIEGKWELGNDSSDIYIDLDEFDEGDCRILGRMMIGPIFRYSIGSKTDAYLSIGPELRLFEIFFESGRVEYAIHIGFGGADLGLKHNFNEMSFLQIGLNAGLQPGERIGTDLIVSPYMGIGFIY